MLLGDATRLPTADASFDVVFLVTVLGEIPDRAAALAECHRVLKPGGVLSISEMFGDPHYQRKAIVRRLATAAGFRPASIEGGFWLYTANFVKP
jgi:ubiquinone/menaquinone biosynthesis C-methylase UbiE